MPDTKDDFTLEDSNRMIKDKIDSYFQKLNVTHDLEELEQVQMEVPPAQETIEG